MASLSPEPPQYRIVLDRVEAVRFWTEPDGRRMGEVLDVETRVDRG